MNASGGVIAYVLSSTHAIEFFQEDMCYLSDKLFRVCDLEKHYKSQVLSKNPVFIDYHLSIVLRMMHKQRNALYMLLFI